MREAPAAPGAVGTPRSGGRPTAAATSRSSREPATSRRSPSQSASTIEVADLRAGVEQAPVAGARRRGRPAAARPTGPSPAPKLIDESTQPSRASGLDVRGEVRAAARCRS